MLLRSLLMLGLAAASIVPSAHAGPLFYRVDINFAAAPLGNAPYSLDLQLNGTLNNTVTATGFSFSAGGGFSGVPTFFGQATASPQAGGFTLSDSVSSFANEIFITLSPTTTMLSFFVTQSDNAPAGGGIPDAFSVALLDNSLANITTTGFGDSLILANIIGGANAPERRDRLQRQRRLQRRHGRGRARAQRDGCWRPLAWPCARRLSPPPTPFRSGGGLAHKGSTDARCRAPSSDLSLSSTLPRPRSCSPLVPSPRQRC